MLTQDERLQYPVGKFTPHVAITTAARNALIDSISALPALLYAATDGMTDAQYDTPYRPGGWTIRQVVHHIFDSHVNAYTRFKLALTEEAPVVKPYDQDGWAALADTALTPISTSLTLIEMLHARWAVLLRSLGDDEFARTFTHPDKAAPQSLQETLRLYDWHGRHHLGHVLLVKGAW